MFEELLLQMGLIELQKPVNFGPTLTNQWLANVNVTMHKNTIKHFTNEINALAMGSGEWRESTKYVEVYNPTSTTTCVVDCINYLLNNNMPSITKRLKNENLIYNRFMNDDRNFQSAAQVAMCAAQLGFSTIIHDESN